MVRICTNKTCLGSMSKFLRRASSVLKRDSAVRLVVAASVVCHKRSHFRNRCGNGFAVICWAARWNFRSSMNFLRLNWTC